MMLRASILILLFLGTNASALDLGGLKSKFKELTQKESSSSSPSKSGLDQYSTQDQIESLKQALNQGTDTAVSNLSKKDGYLGNEKVRIPMPENLKKTDKVLRKLRLGKYSDELITSMNRAAETAVPEARTLLVDAIKKMTVQDASSILTGNDDAATQYFRKNTETGLNSKFKPIVGNAMKKVSVAQVYDKFASKGVKLGLVKERDAKLDEYITRKAIDGLFLIIAEQEKAIRDNPLKATSELVKNIFSAIKP